MKAGKTRILLLGAFGRLGRAVLDTLAEERSFTLSKAVVRPGTSKGTLGDLGFTSFHDVPVEPWSKDLGARGEVVVDVTRPESVGPNLRWAAERRLPYVLAVTGLGPREEREIQKVALKIPIVVAPNMSVGVAILQEVAWIASALLPGADIEIVETHHRGKRDAPSGTALALAKTMAQAMKQTRKIEFGRASKGVRKPGSIVLNSVRGGDVVGEHRVYLFSEGERLELTHIAASRAIFARGALQAARFVARKRAGIYTMRDVLGL